MEYINKKEWEELIGQARNHLYKELALLFEFIYIDGIKIGKAYNQSKIPCTIRTCEMIIKRITGGRITLMDLRRAWLINNPHVLLSRRDNHKKRMPISVRLRWKVLSRDLFRCKTCGQTSKETRLHVDHIIPVSKGGKTSLDNLQTLCNYCNYGKYVYKMEEIWG